MSTAREQVADAIKAAHPLWDVRPYPHVPKQVSPRRPVVSVFRTDLEPAEGGTLRHALTLNLYGAASTGAGAEDELDANLDLVMLTLQAMPGVVFTTASRQTFEETIAGWQVTCHVKSVNVYKQTTILKEVEP